MSKNTLPISLIVTVLNEEKTITSLLEAIADQTKLPKEVIIVDGGSSDVTVQLITNEIKNFPTRLRITTKKGNRSVGRNEAVSQSSQEIVACTDAGCIPIPTWLEKLYDKYLESDAQVVAGYYRGVAKTSFEEAVIPYALVMPGNLDSKNFLPATRSMLFEREVWEQVAGFDEPLSDNEDYAFAVKLKKKNTAISFAQDAVVLWQPRSTLSQFYTMIYRFARGDIQANIFRPKVILIFVRYIFVVTTFLSILKLFSLQNSLVFIVISGLIYVAWSIQKNFAHARKGWYWLPILQVTSDIAVILGSVAGLKLSTNHNI